ncbi:hypothetical protein D9M70_540350 [compost metagenome]
MPFCRFCISSGENVIVGVPVRSHELAKLPFVQLPSAFWRRGLSGTANCSSGPPSAHVRPPLKLTSSFSPRHSPPKSTVCDSDFSML